MELDRLMIYKLDEDSYLYKMAALIEDSAHINTREYINYLSHITRFCIEHAFTGNLWHDYITYYLVYNENPYNVNIEMNGCHNTSLNKLARNDLEILRKLYHYDYGAIDIDVPIEEIIKYSDKNIKSRIYSPVISDRICKLARDLAQSQDVDEFISLLNDFYKTYGVGTLGLHKAFRLDDQGEIIPISNVAKVTLDDLVGYEIQKNKLIDNTNAFVAGRKANNCLLYGDAGTGKSTSIKAIANMYYDKGLRVIEVYKHQFKYINKLISQLKWRNYYFIIYMDDLSFEDNEIEYKYLKAVIEGGLEERPSNILIYATSNRRHLIKESFADNTENSDLHRGDTKEEKLSLADRFGVAIYYGSPTPNEYNNIVTALRDRYDIKLSDEEILAEANKWQINHGSSSGRAAKQFIDYLMGMAKG